MDVKTAEKIDTRIIHFSGQLIDEGYDKLLVAHCMASVGMSALTMFVMAGQPGAVDIHRVTKNRIRDMDRKIEKEICDQSTKH